MKIAMIGQKGVPATWGGVEQHVDHLSQQLSAMNYEVVIYARKHYVSKEKIAEFEQEYPNVKVVTLPTVRSKHLEAIIHTFIATLHAVKENADVYHYHSVGPALLAWIPRLLRPRARVVSTFHSPDRLHQKWGMIARKVLTLGERASVTFAHKTITVSRELQRYCLEQYKRSVFYVPNGVATAQNQRASLISAEFDLKGNDYILVVSRLVRHKGIHYLIDAYKQLNTTKKLVIVGDSAYTDKYVNELHELADGDKNIIFTGYQSGKMLQELFSNAYLYVQPSESEGLSVAVLEAASYGRGILGSDIPSNAEILIDRGFMFENKNVQDLATQLKKLLHSKQLVEDSGKALRGHILEKYNWERISRATVDIYSGNDSTNYETAPSKIAKSQV